MAQAGDPARLPFESIAIIVSEDRSSYTVKGQLAGVYKEDVDITIDDDRTLRIRAIRRASQGTNSMMMDDAEDPPICNIGRNYILPKYADPDNMRADLLANELVIVIYKSSEHIDKKKARTS